MKQYAGWLEFQYTSYFAVLTWMATHSGNRKAEEIITFESKRLAVQLVQYEVYSET